MDCVNPAARHVIAVYGPDDIRHAEANQDIPEDAYCPPLQVEIIRNPQDPAPEQEVQFHGNVTREGAISSWHWDFGDGNTSEAPAPSHAFEEAGNYTVTLNVSDNQGYSNSTSSVVSVSPVDQPDNPGSSEEDSDLNNTDGSEDTAEDTVPGFEAGTIVALASAVAVLRRRRA